MEDKPFAVSVVGYPGWFFCDFIQDVFWFMELCGEDGHSSRAFMRNELGQYERFAYNDVEDGG